MVEKYKRDGIDIVLGCRKCIYTDEKNKKFIKQNKKYIPIVKRKGEYVIINKKGGGLDEDKKAIEQIKLKTDIEKKDKVIEQKKMRIKSMIEKERGNIQQYNISIEDIEKNIELLEIALKNPQSYVFYNDSLRATTGEKIKQLKTKQMLIKKSYISPLEDRIKTYLQVLSKLEEYHLPILSQLETKKKNELEWGSTDNPEKEQFLKEIVEKVTLSNSLEELYTNYKDKIYREGKYLNSYLNENKMNNILLFADTDKEKENYINFMLEMLLNRINDLQERIKIIEKK